MYPRSTARRLSGLYEPIQAGESTFPEFLTASWRAGVVSYDVDFAARTVAYYGCNEEQYVESYPAVDVK